VSQVIDVDEQVRDRRVATLEEYGVLAGPPRRELAALVDLAARIADVPHATINLLTADEQHQVATVGFEGGACSVRDSMCRQVVESQQAILVEDAGADDRFRGNPFTTGELGDVRFYGSHPLVTPDDVVIGTLCVFDSETHPVTAEVADGLALLADRVVDVLELELTSRRLGETNTQLQRANERLASFAGQVSHDLNNPLTGVLFSVELAREELADPGVDLAEVDSMLARTLRGAGRMRDLIDGLLDFARVGTGSGPEDVDLGTLLDAVLEDLDGRLPPGSVRARGLPVVCGHPVQLRAVLQNLVDNAAKFTPPDRTPEVAVTGRRTPAGWRVEVADRGPGVPAGQRERIFEPLARLATDVPGSGIGLATCRRVVEAHGGRMGVDDNPGGGAVVWFELPD
jgi:signal transduction histidine kinase